MGTSVNVTRGKFRAIEITYIGMFSALMMIGANITSIVPFMVIGGVPITLQSFFAILSGALLGSRLGAISMVVYAFIGLVGAPVFAGFSGGIGTIISPTFGFILSFIATAYVTGKLIEKNKKLITFIVAAFVGLIINYVIGTNWMYVAFKFWASAPEGFTYKTAWLMMIPPLPKDIILALFAGSLAFRVSNTMGVVNKNKQIYE